MTTDTKDTIEWFREFFEGRTADEIQHIKTLAEAAFPAKNEPTADLDDGDDRNIAEIRSADEIERFKAAYADILRARALQHDPRAGDTEANDAQLLESDAVHRLIGLPSFCDWAFWQKMEVLDVYMREVEDSFYDKRTMRLYASIKSDLLNFRLETT